MNNPHQNPRTTAYMRELIVARHKAGSSVPLFTDALGISIRTVCKWLVRFAAQGPAASDVCMSDPKILNMPVEFGLELMAIVSPNFFNAEG